MYKHIQGDNFSDVGRFHLRFGLSVSEGRPLHTPREVLEFRMKFLLEEVLEFIHAAGYRLVYTETIDAPPKWGVEKVTDQVDHAGMFDALIDEVYVALGTAHLLGYPWQVGWDEVQRANMAKVRATEETASERGGTFDVIKPPGWVAPDIAGLLRECGWGMPAKHVARELDQGGYCNALVSDLDGYGDVCGLPVNHSVHVKETK